MFGNPVKQAFIRPYGSPIIIGDFRVTAAFGVIDADHPVPHEGTDIGNGKCYEPLLAMCTGRVSYAGGPYGIVRIVWDDDPSYEVAVAHSSHILVSVNQHVVRGQQIATLDRTGTTACHGHLGCKHNGVEVDIWPLLDQNKEEDVLQGSFISAVENRKALVRGDNTRFRSSPFIKADNILAEFDALAEFHPDFLVAGGIPVGQTSAKWYAGFMLTPKGRELGYFHESVLGPLSVIEATGFSQAQLDAAKAAARAAGIKDAAAAAGGIK
jgi:murein DD-endopeptidase MepM/ murein hydrolase activator NlpD